MSEISSTIMSSLILPIILAFCGGIVFLIKRYVDKITKSITTKNELEAMGKANELKQQLLAEVEKTANTAVANNMPKADKYKEESDNGKLTDEQQKELKKAAHDLTYAMLPNSMTEKDGYLLNVIGNKEKLDILIDSYIEKATYDYKFKKK